MGRLLRLAPEHLTPLSQREDRHMTLQSKQPNGTKRFTKVVQTTDFQKGTFLDLRQQQGPFDKHVPPLHSQVFEPPNLADQWRCDRGKKRHVHCDNPAEVSQTALKPYGSDVTTTTETNDATPTPTVSTETPETRVQLAPVTNIFDEGTTPTTSLSQMFERNHASRRNAAGLTRQADSPHKKNHQKHSPNMQMPWSMQSIKPLGDRGFVDEMLSQIKPHVVCGAMISESPSRACRSSTGKCVCVLLAYLQPRTPFRSATSPDRWSLPKNREVSMSKLDVDQQTNMRDAMADDWRDTVVAPQVPRREGCTTFKVRCKTCHEDAADSAFQGRRTRQSTTGDHYRDLRIVAIYHKKLTGNRLRTRVAMVQRQNVAGAPRRARERDGDAGSRKKSWKSAVHSGGRSRAFYENSSHGHGGGARHRA